MGPQREYCRVWTEWVLPVIKEAIQFKAEAVMPNCTSRTCRRMEGSTQSNAALKSRRKRAVVVIVGKPILVISLVYN